MACNNSSTADQALSLVSFRTRLRGNRAHKVNYVRESIATLLSQEVDPGSIWAVVLDEVRCDCMPVCIELLLGQLNVNVNYQSSRYRNSALHRCARAGDSACCRKLIEEGADLNLLDRDELTPLNVCLTRNIPGDSRIEDLLISYGALVPKPKNTTRYNPKCLAILEGFLERKSIMQDFMVSVKLFPKHVSEIIVSYCFLPEAQVEKQRKRFLVRRQRRPSFGMSMAAK